MASRSGVCLGLVFKACLNKLWSSTVSYIVLYSILGSVLGIKLVLDLGLGFLSILFIIGY